MCKYCNHVFSKYRFVDFNIVFPVLVIINIVIIVITVSPIIIHIIISAILILINVLISIIILIIITTTIVIGRYYFRMLRIITLKRKAEITYTMHHIL